MVGFYLCCVKHLIHERGLYVQVSANEGKGFMKILKWAGILALVTVPLVALFKKKSGEEPVQVSPDDDDNIFEAELKG